METRIESNGSGLRQYRAGSVRESFFLFLPLIFSIFSGSLMSFCDRLFISHYSLDSLKAVTVSNYFCMFFQIAISRITAMTQVCVGKSYGEQRMEILKPYCWQMIWFSVLSMGITLPMGMWLIPYLFEGTEIAVEGSAYFRILMFGNFLFPLGVTLSAYFAGLGRTKIVGICSVGAQIANVGLNYLLIFGTSPWIPALGVKGAALGTTFSQALLCLVLLILFFKESPEHRVTKWSINKKLFKEVLFLGLPRSLAKILVLITWNMAVRLILKLEGDYLLVLSIGSSILLIYSPIIQTLEQVLTTQVSFYRGKKSYSTIWRSVRSSIVLLLIGFFILGTVFLFYLDWFISFFIHELIAPRSLEMIKLSCLWLWIFFFLEGLNLISFGLISGLGLTWFKLRLNIISSWPTIYLPYYLAFRYWHLDPDKIWMLCWICMIVVIPVSFIKAKKFIKKLENSSETRELGNLLKN